MNALSALTSAQLIKAAKIMDQIARLQKQLDALLGSPAPAKTANPPAVKPAKKRTMSAAGRAAIRKAQKARWAKINAAKKSAK